MTTLQFINPSHGASFKAGEFGELVCKITKSAMLVIYSVTFTIRNANQVVAWEGQGDISGDEAKADINWPSAPGNYIASAVLCNGLGTELARVQMDFVVN